MPLISGKYYANPAYGEALERARAGDADGELTVEDLAAEQHPARAPGRARSPETPAQHASRAYNETSGLRPTTQRGPGSAEDLHQGRVAMSHVIENRQAVGNFGGMASNKLTPSEAQAVQHYPPARAAFNDSLSAAHEAASQPDPTKGATQLYLDYSQGPPSWAIGRKPVAVYGPFKNVAGGGDVPKGAMVRIVIIR